MTLLNATESPSTRPYLIRALYEWCCDNGFTPYVAVQVDDSVRVPRESVKNGEIVLNISMDATSAMQLGNEYIEFKARFGGIAREIVVPIDHVMAIYARENGQGMAFPMGEMTTAAPLQGDTATMPRASDAPSNPASSPQRPSKPHLVEILHTGKSQEVATLSTSDDAPEPPPKAPRPTLKRIK